jgi:capsular polysaccharide biosynthesis protein
MPQVLRRAHSGPGGKGGSGDNGRRLPVWKKALWVVLASAFVAAIVYAESALQPPTYEASAVLLVGPKEPRDGKIHLIPNAPAPGILNMLVQTTTQDIDSRPVAEETIRRLGVGRALSQDRLRDNLTVERVESSGFLQLRYTDTDPGRAAQVANTVGLVTSERYAVMVGEDGLTATLFQKASVPTTLASPKPGRDALIALVVALALASLAALIEARRRVRLNEGRER